MRKRPVLLVQALFASCLFAPQSLLAQGGDAPAVESFDVIKKESDDAYQDWMDAYRKAAKGGDKELIKKIASQRPDGSAFIGRVTAILEAKPADEDGASAAIWMIGAARAKGQHLEQALGALLEHHAGSEKLKTVMLSLQRNPAPASTHFLGELTKSSPNAEIRGRSCFSLAQNFKTRARTIRAIADGSSDDVERYVTNYGQEVVDHLKKQDAGKNEADAEKWFEAVLANKDFAAIDYFRGTLGDEAKKTLYELRNLSIGKVAPDIIGEDIDGTAMKLSDYRGKVVVIDFWGDW